MRRAHGLVALLFLVALTGCGDGDNDGSPRPTPTPGPSLGSDRAEAFVGTYDVALSGDLGDHVDLVGAVFATEDGVVTLDVQLSSREHVVLRGALDEDGTLDLTGSATTPRRTIEVHGRGVATRDTAAERIVGTVKATNSFLEFGLTFAFDRRRGARVSPFLGTHRFAFSPSPSGCACDSTATFEIASQTNGFGRLDFAAVERDANGVEIGVFDGGRDCFVTPTGRLFCFLSYRPPGSDPPYREAYLFGHLARAADTPTVGRIEVRTFGEDETTHAAWTATRIILDPGSAATTSP